MGVSVTGHTFGIDGHLLFFFLKEETTTLKEDVKKKKKNGVKHMKKNHGNYEVILIWQQTHQTTLGISGIPMVFLMMGLSLAGTIIATIEKPWHFVEQFDLDEGPPFGRLQ